MSHELNKKIFTTDLTEGAMTDKEPFVLAFFEERVTPKKHRYISAILTDNKGSIKAMIPCEVARNFEKALPGNIVQFTGKVENLGYWKALMAKEATLLTDSLFNQFDWAINSRIGKPELVRIGKLRRSSGIKNYNEEMNRKIDLLLKMHEQENNAKPSVSIGKLNLASGYIGYSNGERYQPNSGITKSVVRSLSSILGGRRRSNGKFSLNTTLTNLQSVAESDGESFSKEQIKNAIYTIKGNPKIRSFPITIAVNRETISIQED